MAKNVNLTKAKKIKDAVDNGGIETKAAEVPCAMQIAILEAKRRSGLKQNEIAERMGIPSSNVCRIEHSGDAITYKTFSAYLKACGFGFSLKLVRLKRNR